MVKNMKHNILLLCDLKLPNGGAQKITYKTLKCISEYFNIIIYSKKDVSEEFLSLIKILGIKSFLVDDLNENEIIEIINQYGIEAILIQWENPEWISISYRVKMKTGIRVILLIHLLPYIGTPVNRYFKNFYLLATLYIIRSALGKGFYYLRHKILISHEELTNKQKSPYIKDHFRSKLIKIIKEKILQFQDVKNGIKYFDLLIAMGPASLFYVNEYLHIFKNVKMVEHNAAVDISKNNSDMVREYKYDICFMSARNPKGKGVLLLPEIVYRASKNLRKDIKVVIMGRFVHEDIREKFLKKIDKYGLRSSFTLTGFVSEYEKFNLLRSSRIFVYPSIKDVFSISLAEALASGLPSVVFKVPFTEQFNSGALFRIKYKDLKSYSEKVADLLKMSYEKPDEFKKLSEMASLSIFNEFSWEKTCQEQINLIKYVFNE